MDRLDLNVPITFSIVSFPTTQTKRFVKRKNATITGVQGCTSSNRYYSHRFPRDRGRTMNTPTLKPRGSQNLARRDTQVSHDDRCLSFSAGVKSLPSATIHLESTATSWIRIRPTTLLREIRCVETSDHFYERNVRIF